MLWIVSREQRSTKWMEEQKKDRSPDSAEGVRPGRANRKEPRLVSIRKIKASRKTLIKRIGLEIYAHMPAVMVPGPKLS
jgi:hypothetical protein